MVSTAPLRAAFRPKLKTWTWLIVFLACMALVDLSFLWSVRGQIRSGSNDFMHLYAAGRMTRVGQGAQLFDAQSQFTAQHDLSEFVRVTGSPYPYMRPPFEALLFVPFSYFPLQTAYLLWVLTSLLLLAVCVRLLRARAPALRAIPRAFWFVAPLAFFPFIVVLGQGQDDLLLLLLFTLAFLALCDKRDLAAGGWLGLALFRPQFTLPLVAVLAFSRRWGALLGVALVALGLGLVTAAVYGWTMLLDYPRHVWLSEHALSQEGSLLAQMPTIHGLLSVLLRPASDLTIFIGVVVLSGIVLFWAAHFYEHNRSHAPDMAFSAALVASILVSYHTFDHGLSVLFLPVLLQLNYLLTSRHRRITAWLLLVPALPLFLYPLSSLMLSQGMFYLYPLALLLWLAGTAAAAADTGSTLPARSRSGPESSRDWPAGSG